MTCTSLKVTCSCADQDFILADNALAASPAYTAVRVHNNSSCLHKDVQKSLFQSLSIDCLTCRHYKETYSISNFFAFDHFRTYSQVLDTSVVAGT